MKSCKILSLKEVCLQLNITEASGRNWIKLGKLIPDLFDAKRPLFYQSNIDVLHSKLTNGENKALKSRRNKRHINGNSLYEAYLSPDSKNKNSVRELFKLVQNRKKMLTDSEILYIIADAGLKMFADAGLKKDAEVLAQKRGSDKKNRNAYSSYEVSLLAYLKNPSCLNPSTFDREDLYGFDALVHDLIDDAKKAASFVLRHSELFSFEFFYEPEEDVLGMIYLSLKNLSARKSKGVYYTPKRVVQKLFGSLHVRFSPQCTWLDPCSGTGNFLLQLPRHIPLENIYAMDIDADAIFILRLNLALKHLSFDYELLKKNCAVCDFLLESERFLCDIIIGNPPWGYEFKEHELTLLKERFGKKEQRGKIESYDLFLEQAIRHSKEGGLICFVLPEAILNVKSHRNIRAFMLEKTKFKYLEYLGNAFSKVHCPAILLTLEKSRKPSCSGMHVRTKDHSFYIESDRELDCSAFNFDIADNEYNVLMKICKFQPCAFLKEKSDFALGIVTGDNEAYLSKIKTPTNEQVVKGCDILKYRVMKSERYLEFKRENLQQVAPTEYYRAPEKLFYRFICNQPVFAYDDCKTLSLNSCNILIPKIEKMKMKYILAILNSRIVQFYFQKRFHSIKVLRSHIESIPIPIISLKEQEKIVSFVDEITALTDPCRRLELYNKMDGKIAKLFQLSKKDYKTILAHVKSQNLFLNEN